MKTLITLEVEHKHPIPDLAEHAAQRIYTLQGVDGAVVVKPLQFPVSLRKIWSGGEVQAWLDKQAVSA